MTTNRKEIDSFGKPRDRDYVRVFRELVDGDSVVRVQWKEPNRKTRTFADNRVGIAAAKAYAKGTHERLGLPADAGRVFALVSLREMFERYVDVSEIDWRTATAKGKRSHWRLLELHVGKDRPAASLTKEHLDSLKKALINSYPKGGDRKKSINQVRATLNTIVAVYRWAIDNEVIAPSKLITYRPKFAKNLTVQVVKTAEYSQEEREKISAAMDMEDSRNWRAAVLTELFRYCGPRKNAAINLEWPDVDFVNERIRWRIESDKQGQERWQPMPEPVRDALIVAYRWSLKFGYAGRFVFFRPGAGTRKQDTRTGSWNESARDRARAARQVDKPYTYSAYIGALHRYERAAGVEPVLFKGSHAFRRAVAGDVARAKGTKAAAEWIGDRSLKVVDKHYILERESELRDTASLVSKPSTSQD
jgi:integrase